MQRQELYRTAHRAVEERRQQANMQARRQRQAIYKAVPELEQLSFQRASEGAAAASLAAAGSPLEAAEHLEKLQGIAQRRALLLAQHGYKESDLQPQYGCSVCRDTGYDGGAVCTCVREEAKRLRREEINNSGPLTLCRFQTFSLDVYPEKMEDDFSSPREIMGRILAECRDYAADFGPRSPSLLLFGDAGLGKTHLALSIAAEVLEKGYDVIYVSAQNAFSEISANRFNSENGLFASMQDADLLILDDLGTEFLDAYLLSKIYELVNGRMHHKATIYTTNICKQDLLNRRYTEKVASRLLGECHLMRFAGKDLRLAGRK